MKFLRSIVLTCLLVALAQSAFAETYKDWETTKGSDSCLAKTAINSEELAGELSFNFSLDQSKPVLVQAVLNFTKMDEEGNVIPRPQVLEVGSNKVRKLGFIIETSVKGAYWFVPYRLDNLITQVRRGSWLYMRAVGAKKNLISFSLKGSSKAFQQGVGSHCFSGQSSFYNKDFYKTLDKAVKEAPEGSAAGDILKSLVAYEDLYQEYLGFQAKDVAFKEASQAVYRLSKATGLGPQVSQAHLGLLLSERNQEKVDLDTTVIPDLKNEIKTADAKIKQLNSDYPTVKADYENKSAMFAPLHSQAQLLQAEINSAVNVKEIVENEIARLIAEQSLAEGQLVSFTEKLKEIRIGVDTFNEEISHLNLFKNHALGQTDDSDDFHDTKGTIRKYEVRRRIRRRLSEHARFQELKRQLSDAEFSGDEKLAKQTRRQMREIRKRVRDRVTARVIAVVTEEKQGLLNQAESINIFDIPEAKGAVAAAKSDLNLKKSELTRAKKAVSRAVQAMNTFKSNNSYDAKSASVAQALNAKIGLENSIDKAKKTAAELAGTLVKKEERSLKLTTLIPRVEKQILENEGYVKAASAELVSAEAVLVSAEALYNASKVAIEQGFADLADLYKSLSK